MSITRVVITGLGVVSPLGVGLPFNWQRLLKNSSGLRSLNESEYEGIPSRVAARVPMGDEEGSLNMSKYFPRASDLKPMPLASAFVLVAAQEALEQSQVRTLSFLEILI